MNWYIKALKKYAVLEGRARRKEFWYFCLFNIIIGGFLAFIDAMTGTFTVESGMGLLGSIYTLAVLSPGVAVSVRRLHDTGRSGWWFLINLIPFIGVIVFFIFIVQDSVPGENQYGPSPKGVEA